jgi:glycosyltransferase involved in cell wall biosynthesis
VAERLEFDLSIIIPAYNEAENIASTLQDIARQLNSRNLSFEVIVVDDGSNDATAQIAAAAPQLFKNFTLLKNSRNQGKGFTVQRGVFASRGALILFMDADNSTHISELTKLQKALNTGADLAIGSRRLKASCIKTPQPLKRRLLGKIYIWLAKAILGVKASDYNCGFKLFKREAAIKLFGQITRKDWSFDSELLYLAKKSGLKVTEVAVVWEDVRKTSKVKPLQDGISSFLGLWKIRLTHYYSKIT